MCEPLAPFKNTDFELSLALCVPLELQPLPQPHNPSASPFCVHLCFFSVRAMSVLLHAYTHVRIYIHTLLDSVTAFLAWIAV